MASPTPAPYVRGQRTSAPEERGVRGLRCHAEWPQVADAVIEAKNFFAIARDWRRASGPQAKWKRPARIVSAVGARAPPNTYLQVHVEERAGTDPQRGPPLYPRAHYCVNSRHCKRAVTPQTRTMLGHIA